jgi:Protein of unknown function (DUF2490)
MKTAWLLAAALMLVPATAARADDDAQLWLILVGDLKLDSNDSLTANIIYRSRPDELEAGQRILRAGLSHKLKGGASVAFSYSHVQSFVDNAPDGIQHRIGQSVGLSLGKGVDARIQAEEIFAQGGGDIGLRARGRLRWVHPLTNNGDIDLQLSDELILSANDTDWGQNAGWTANRTGAAVHFKLGKHIGIAPGYTWQLVNRRTGANRNDHILGLTVDTHF